MEELEAQLAAFELLQIERLALDPSEMLARLHRAIASRLNGEISESERAVRELALKLIEDDARQSGAVLGASATGDEG